ncbi:LacI family DNA-binding transcriptional regulator [bacterium]|nr:LacI family DNA-binding transcriptional regulator [bacterium]
MPTIKDVAKKAGVSVTAVSFVINNVPVPLSEKTKERIWAAIRELGYSPNRAAQSLARRRAETIAILFLQPVSNIFADIPYSQILFGVGSKLAQSGLRLLLIPPIESNEETPLRRKLHKGEADGVIVVGPIRQNDKRIKELDNSDLPVILIGNYKDAKKASCIDIDNFAVGYKAADYLISIGHKSIAFLGGPLYYSYGQERFLGYKKALEENNLPFDEENVHIAPATVEEGYNATLKLLEKENKPTAIFASTGLMGVGAIRALRDKGLHLPDDISLITLQEYPTSLMEIEPTAIVPPFYRLGLISAIALLKLINGERQPPIHKKIPIKIRIGSTTKPLT